MGLLSRGAMMVGRTLRASEGVDITYQRGAESLSITAIVGTSQVMQVVSDESATAWQTRDYMILASDLTFRGIVSRPESGDRIIESIGSDTVTSEVLAIDGEQCWRWSDHGQTSIRIHTKRIGVEL